MGWGFADEVRKKMKEEGAAGHLIRISELALALDLISDEDKRPLYRVLCDFRKAGEVERVEPGVYRLLRRSSENNKKKAMWQILRARRLVSVDDLEELTGASPLYAKEFLYLLQKREIVKKLGNGKWQLVNDPVVLPEDEKKIQRMRNWRKKKKSALKALDKVARAVAEAKDALTDAD